FVPVQHRPFKSAKPALQPSARHRRDQRLADAPAAVCRLNENVFQIEARLTPERRKRWKVKRESDRAPFDLRKERFGIGRAAEEPFAQVGRRRLSKLSELFVDGQLPDQIHERLRIVGPTRPESKARVGAHRAAFSISSTWKSLYTSSSGRARRSLKMPP